MTFRTQTSSNNSLNKQNSHYIISVLCVCVDLRRIYHFFVISVMIATEAEMQAAKIPLEDRDYCAHKLIDYKQCRQEVWPWTYQCAHEKHAYLTCKFDE